MNDPAELGRLILERFDRGRAAAIAQARAKARKTDAAVGAELVRETLAGVAARGRCARIARMLGVPRETVRDSLKRLEPITAPLMSAAVSKVK